MSYSLLRDSQVYGYLASLPLVPVAAAVILVLALIKRFWVSAAVAGSMAMISCLPYLMAWGFATTTFDGRRLTMAASDYGYDHILSLLCCFILAVCWTVVISQWAQFQRHRAQPAYQV